jgi:hypothetical protein
MARNILIQSDDAAQLSGIETELKRDLASAGLDQSLTLLPTQSRQRHEAMRGADPVTLASIALVAAGAGGALTVAMGKDGFFTALARVLEKYVERRCDICMEDKNGRKIELSGPAGEIRQMLKEHLADSTGEEP